MKARLKDNYRIDENHILVAGAKVEITDGWCGCNGYYYNCIMPDNERMYVGGNEFAGSQQTINDNILEIIDHSPYINWEQRRYEVAKAAMQGILSNEKRGGTIEDVAFVSVRYADALIEEIKMKN